MDDNRWLYVSDGETAGPVSDPALRALVDSGFLDAGSLVWTDALNEWTPLKRVSGFEHLASDSVIRDDRELGSRFALLTLPGQVSDRATAALYLGWLSVLLLPGPLAIAAGIGALRELREVRRRTGLEASGKGKAIFGLAAGSIATLVLVWLVSTAALT